MAKLIALISSILTITLSITGLKYFNYIKENSTETQQIKISTNEFGDKAGTGRKA